MPVVMPFIKIFVVVLLIPQKFTSVFGHPRLQAFCSHCFSRSRPQRERTHIRSCARKHLDTTPAGCMGPIPTARAAPAPAGRAARRSSEPRLGPKGVTLDSQSQLTCSRFLLVPVSSLVLTATRARGSDPPLPWPCSARQAGERVTLPRTDRRQGPPTRRGASRKSWETTRQFVPVF